MSEVLLGPCHPCKVPRAGYLLSLSLIMTVHPEEGHQAVDMKQVPWLAFGLKLGLPPLLIAHQPPTLCGASGSLQTQSFMRALGVCPVP